jgi:hypothetical protein
MVVRAGHEMQQMYKKVNAFEQWCYRRMMKISYKDHVRNEKILRKIDRKMQFVRKMKKRKLECTGHVFRGSSEE